MGAGGQAGLTRGRGFMGCMGLVEVVVGRLELNALMSTANGVSSRLDTNHHLLLVEQLPLFAA